MKARYKSVWSTCLDHGMNVEALHLVELLGGAKVNEYQYKEFTEALLESSKNEEFEEDKRKMLSDLGNLINSYYE